MQMKKNGFFMKNDWTVCILLIILMGSFAPSGFSQAVRKTESVTASGSKKENLATADDKTALLEAQLKAVKEELKVVRKALADALNESDKKEAEYARLKLSIAASLADGKKKAYDTETVKVLEALRDVSDTGEKLVTASAEFCDYIDVLLDKDKITDVERVRARYRLDKLRAAAEVFHARIQKPAKARLFSSCRVLALNDKLQLVVLSIGSVYGMRNGLILTTGKKDDGDEDASAVKVKVVAVRPFISGAIIVDGDIEDIAPGMTLYPGQ